MKEKPITILREFETQTDDRIAIDNAISECEEIDARCKKTGFVSAPDATRKNTLIAKISLLKERGIHADEIRKAELNHSLIAEGKRPINFSTELPAGRRKLVNSYRQLARGAEVRAIQEAGQVTVSPQGGTSGSFVPVEFIFSGLQIALKSYSPLFDADKVTWVSTENGRPTMVPTLDDTALAENIVSEGLDDSVYSNIAQVYQTTNYTAMFRTPKIATSVEFGEDALANLTVGFLENIFADRLARGVGQALLHGSGSIPGLLPSLITNGVPYVVAQGSSSDDGGAETGATSIGSQDLRNLFYSVDRAYRNSPKAAWLMADSTLNAIDSLRDKQGHLQHLVKYDGNGQPLLFGKPVYCEPNLPAIGPSATTVLFGDFSRWLTRYSPAASFVTRFSELPGFAEAGVVAWQTQARFGGTLMSISSAQTPINYLVQFS